MNLRLLRFPLLAAVFALVPVGAFAQAKKPAIPPSASPLPANYNESLKDSVRQVDGITSRVIDDVWEHTDAFWHEGDYNRVVALLRICIAADPSFVEAYSSGSWLLWSMGDSQGADALLADGERRSPEKADIYYEYGWQMYRTKRYAQAAQYLQRSIQQPKAGVLSYTTLGHSLTKLKRYDEAVKVWEQVVKKFPHFVAGPHNLDSARQQAAKSKAERS